MIFSQLIQLPQTSMQQLRSKVIGYGPGLVIQTFRLRILRQQQQVNCYVFACQVSWMPGHLVLKKKMPIITPKFPSDVLSASSKTMVQYHFVYYRCLWVWGLAWRLLINPISLLFWQWLHTISIILLSETLSRRLITKCVIERIQLADAHTCFLLTSLYGL